MFSILFLKDFGYLFMRDTEEGRDIGRGRSRLLCAESDAGLDPRTLGSQPEPKADPQPLSHSGISTFLFVNRPFLLRPFTEVTEPILSNMAK